MQNITTKKLLIILEVLGVSKQNLARISEEPMATKIRLLNEIEELVQEKVQEVVAKRKTKTG